LPPKDLSAPRESFAFLCERINRAFWRASLSGALPYHQEDFETPGISPRSASWRKHKRQMPNLRRKARGRPHSLQRLCLRVENLGFLASLTLFAVVAIQSFVKPSNFETLKPTPGTAFPDASTASAPGCRWRQWSRSLRSCPSACRPFRTRSPGKSVDHAGRA